MCILKLLFLCKIRSDKFIRSKKKKIVMKNGKVKVKKDNKLTNYKKSLMIIRNKTLITLKKMSQSWRFHN